MGADYAHADGLGYVTVNGEDVMMVHWTNDGVEFDDHNEHPMTFDLLKEALNVLNHIEEIQTEDDSEDWEWV